MSLLKEIHEASLRRGHFRGKDCEDLSTTSDKIIEATIYITLHSYTASKRFLRYLKSANQSSRF